jgi:hypothetical protein
MNGFSRLARDNLACDAESEGLECGFDVFDEGDVVQGDWDQLINTRRSSLPKTPHVLRFTRIWRHQQVG